MNLCSFFTHVIAIDYLCIAQRCVFFAHSNRIQPTDPRSPSFDFDPSVFNMGAQNAFAPPGLFDTGNEGFLDFSALGLSNLMDTFPPSSTGAYDLAAFGGFSPANVTFNPLYDAASESRQQQS